MSVFKVHYMSVVDKILYGKSIDIIFRIQFDIGP